MPDKTKLAVIGSAVADVIITLPHLPTRSEDVHVRTQELRLGGCAYNTYDTIRHFGIDAIPFFPVGTGAYGDFVRKCFKERGIETPIPEQEAANGCCYCYVEDDGERTFLSYHGAEYRFEESFFSLLEDVPLDSVYICGLEIEEPTGINIVRFLEERKKCDPGFTIFFAPGPRIMKIQPALMERLLSLGPVLHLNEDEACSYTGENTREAAAAALYQRTCAPVIITLGQHGCCCRDGDRFDVIPAVKTTQLDTVGAGDAHIGAVIACLRRGMTLPQAIAVANRVSARVVATQGALLSEEAFREAVSDLL